MSGKPIDPPAARRYKEEMLSALLWIGTIVQVLSALAIIGVVLLQQGKGASMSAAFGAGGSQAFGARTDEMMTKITGWCAGGFLVSSLLLSLLSGRVGSEVQTAGTGGRSELPAFQSLADQPADAAAPETAAEE